MRYKIYEIDPEFEQSQFLYVVLARPFDHFKEAFLMEKWQIFFVCFSQKEVEEMIFGAIKRGQDEKNRYDVKYQESHFSTLKIKLPNNVSSRDPIQRTNQMS